MIPRDANINCIGVAVQNRLIWFIYLSINELTIMVTNGLRSETCVLPPSE